MPEALARTPEEGLERFFISVDASTTFRSGQREAIEAIVSGDDALVILPTGAGKSLVYQVAALMLPSTTLVVSPLIALMRDQTEDLRERGYPGVAALHSQVSEAEQRDVCDALREGRLRLLYVTPERCTDDMFLEAAREARISLLAVDEAHCISEWGHDFRPSYLLIDDAARALGRPPIAALTATATPWVREDVVQRLGLRRPRMIVRGFDRPNLFYEVYPAADEREKRRLLTQVIARQEADYPSPLAELLAQASGGDGIVYTATTKCTSTLAQHLNRHGVPAAYYHGQLATKKRSEAHDRFRESTVRVVVATNAFGMGIDRADLRYVVHYDATASLEAYYQESGRAGRDGDVARCPLFYRPEDIGRAAFLGGTGVVEAGELERVVATLKQAPSTGLTRTVVARQSDLSPTRAIRALEILVAIEAVSERRGRYHPIRSDDGAVQQAVDLETRRHEQERTKREMVRKYADIEGCRRQFLLQYFGEYDAPDYCGMCDHCVPRQSADAQVAVTIEPTAAQTPAMPRSPFQPGDVVEHESLGRGTVVHVDDDNLTIQFADVGYRTLHLQTVLDQGLLRRTGRAA